MEIKTTTELKEMMTLRLSEIRKNETNLLWKDLLTCFYTAFSSLSDAQVKNTSRIRVYYYMKSFDVFRDNFAEVICGKEEVKLFIGPKMVIGYFEDKDTKILLKDFFSRVEADEKLQVLSTGNSEYDLCVEFKI